MTAGSMSWLSPHMTKHLAPLGKFTEPITDKIITSLRNSNACTRPEYLFVYYSPSIVHNALRLIRSKTGGRAPQHLRMSKASS